MVTYKIRILEGTVVGPRPVGGSRFLKGHFCVWKKIAGQEQPVSRASPTAHRNILAFLREKSGSSATATCCWRDSLPAIFSTRTNPVSNESLFSVRVFLPLKKRESFHIKKCTNISLLSTWVALAGNRHKTPRDSSESMLVARFRKWE